MQEPSEGPGGGLHRLAWTGLYYDGRTANRQEVSVTLVDDGLRLRTADGRERIWPFAQLRQTQGTYSGEHLRLEFGANPVESLVVDQPVLVAAIRLASPRANPTLRGRLNSARFAAIMATALAAIVAFYVWGAPLLASRLAPLVPASWEAHLGAASVERLVREANICENPVVTAGVGTVMDRLLASAPASPYQFRLTIVQDSSVNAFAAPGGFIVVNSGLLSAARTPEELAGVLAHEVQHVVHRHSTRAVIRDVPLRFALMTMSGNYGLDGATGIAAALGTLVYVRSDEVEADREGMRMLQAARVDPTGMVSFMRGLDANEREPPRLAEYLSSHPRVAARAASLQALTAEARYAPEPIMSAAAWEPVRSGCR